MKKLVLMLVMAALVAAAQAALVDDFESYSPGTLSSVTGGNWVTSPAPTAGTSLAGLIAVDPMDAGNNVLDITNNTTAQIGAYGLLAGDEIVTNGTIKTLKMRVYASATSSNTHFGLTTADAPNGFGNFLPQLYFNLGNFGVRNAGSNVNLMTYAPNTWYYLWAVIDNSTNTFDVYVKSIDSAATVADKKADNVGFRGVGAGNPDGDLDRFFTISNFGTGVAVGTRVLFDDIHIVAGEDLTAVPEPATMALLGLGAVLLLRKK